MRCRYAAMPAPIFDKICHVAALSAAIAAAAAAADAAAIIADAALPLMRAMLRHYYAYYVDVTLLYMPAMSSRHAYRCRCHAAAEFRHDGCRLFFDARWLLMIRYDTLPPLRAVGQRMSAMLLPPC